MFKRAGRFVVPPFLAAILHDADIWDNLTSYRPAISLHTLIHSLPFEIRLLHLVMSSLEA